MKIADLFAKLSIRPDKKSFDVADNLLGKVKAALAGIVAYKTVQWIGGLVAQTTELGGRFADLAQQVGVAIEPLQQLEYAANLSGVPLESLAGALQKFSKAADEANRGGDEQRDTFRALGVAYRNANGELRPVEDMLGDVAETIAAMPDGAAKTALAMRAFGRSGAQMIPLLNEGRDGIVALRSEFVELGAQMDEGTAKSLEEFGDQQDKVKYALIGVRNDAVKALLPELKRMVTGLLAWVKANRKFIQQKITSIIKGLITVVRILAKGIGFLVSMLTYFADHVGLVITVLGSLAAAFVYLKWASIQAAASSAIAWVAAALPLIAIAALIAAVILIVEDLWTWFRGGESVFGNLYDWAVEGLVGWIPEAERALKVFWSWLTDKFDEFGDWVDDLLGRVDILYNLRKQVMRMVDQQSDAHQAQVTATQDQLRARAEVADRAFTMKQLTGLDTFPGLGMEAVPRLPVSAVPANQVELSPKFEINVTASPGESGDETARRFKAAAREAWDGMMRDTAAATGGSR